MQNALRLFVVLLAAISAANAATPPRAATEEFCGPFAGWKDLKTDFGAKGDGKADDTAALKAGLEALAVAGKGKPGDPYVLYLSAGT
jgi:hypothetical protein